MSLDKDKIFKTLHERMQETYGEGYVNKNNAIKDAASSPAMKASNKTNGVGKLIKPKKKPKVFNDNGEKFVRIPVSFNIDIYLEHGEKTLTLNEIKNRLNEMDSMEVADLVFDSMDYKNVLKEY